MSAYVCVFVHWRPVLVYTCVHIHICVIYLVCEHIGVGASMCLLQMCMQVHAEYLCVLDVCECDVCSVCPEHVCAA